jgi:hypothetical protein
MQDERFRTREVWVAREEEEFQLPVSAHIIWVQEFDDAPYYELSFTEGPFSGYPAIKISAESLKFLNDTLSTELRMEAAKNGVGSGKTNSRSRGVA